MRARTLVLAAVIGLSASPVAAQVDQDDISEGAYDDAPDEAGEGEEASAPAKEEPGDPNVGEESEPASDDGRPADDEGRAALEGGEEEADRLEVQHRYQDRRLMSKESRALSMPSPLDRA